MLRSPIPVLLHHLPALAAQRHPDACALTQRTRTTPAQANGGAPPNALATWGESLSYGALQQAVEGCAAGLAQLGLQRAERVAVYLDKCFEAVIASFAAPAAGGALVPLNPLLKPEQVAFILADCEARVLVTTADRLARLAPVLAGPAGLRHVVLIDEETTADTSLQTAPPPWQVTHWQALQAAPRLLLPRVIDTDMAAILYTSGSTGRPKGVVLSHRNLVEGGRSVASYLGNHAGDTLLAALPLSFDAGFSQLTTAFHAGARVVLLNYLMPRDVLKAIDREGVTGLTAVPPLYIQLAQLTWGDGVAASLRYFANTGGRMPRDTLDVLRRRLPQAQPFLMYGLTESFRSTFLPPEEVDRRPDSIGRAIPNAEVLVLRQDGSPCAPGEAGELVHRGALVGLGYWKDAEKTAERYKPLPAGAAGRPAGLPLAEIAVFSGDTVRQDEDGFFYFIGRRDEMIKTSGYRVSPTEIEEVLYASQQVGECVVFGVEHAVLGQAIQAIATPVAGAASIDVPALLAVCRARLPAYMVPADVEVAPAPLPRNPNGKLDRKLLSTRWAVQRQSNP